MIRTFFRGFFGLVLRIFFRRIELSGLERVPPTGPVIFVLNHPNALIDPAFMLCLTPRPVSFLAKSTLFTMPVVGAIVRGFDSLPLYRRQDGGGDNLDTFTQARALLARGGTLAIFPEGTSHSDPRMRPLKTGAARIALGAQLDGLLIHPAGLYYHAKGTFRSAALLHYGEPFEVARVPMDDDGQPPRDAVNALTDRIEEALNQLTLQADHGAALSLIERAERIFSAADEDPDLDALSERFALKQRFIEGYQRLQSTHPALLDALERRIRRYEGDLERLGLDPEHPAPAQFTVGNSLRYALKSLLTLGVLLPVAMLGTALHAPAWLLTRHLSVRLARGEDDMVGTIKILAAMLWYLVTWVAAASAAAFFGGPVAFGAAALAGPASAWVALRFHERFDRTWGAARGLILFLTRRSLFERLHDERRQIRAEILALAEVL